MPFLHQGKHALKGEGKEERHPKLNSVSKTRSQLRLALKETHKIDMDDEIKYPDVKKKWKAYTELLAKEGNLLFL